MIYKTMRTILQTLSYGNIEVESSRKLVDLKKLDAISIFLKKLDTHVYNGDYAVPLRIYFPTEEAMKNEEGKSQRTFGPSVFSWRRMGDRECGNLQPCLCPYGQIYRSSCDFRGIPFGTGIPFPHSSAGLLCSCQCPVCR